jgi:hypothetical protein
VRNTSAHAVRVAEYAALRVTHYAGTCAMRVAEYAALRVTHYFDGTCAGALRRCRVAELKNFTNFAICQTRVRRPGRG